MHISRIIIEGFKSYKKKVIIDFDAGHNCIIGKNGSGKSNILAAISFVLSTKFHVLRQEERQQLLHDAGQSGCQSAYVEIIFDNSDQRFPNKEQNLSIKRSIGAKKDEYFLNGRHSTKSEISNLLESAGIALSNQYFIVEQGSISKLIRGRDSERLQLMREIAGTRVYDERRRDSMKIMSSADHKRGKVNVIIDYFNERLTELEAERSELAEYEKLDRKRRSIEYCSYNLEKKSTEAQLDRLQSREESTTENNNQMHNKLKVLDIQINKYKKQISNLSKKNENFSIKYNKHKDDLNQNQKYNQSLSLNIEQTKKNLSDNKSKSKKLENELKDILNNISVKQNDLEKVNQEFNDLQDQEKHLKQNLNSYQLELNDLYSKQERLNEYRNKTQRNKFLRTEISKIEQELDIDLEKLANINQQITKTQLLLENKTKNLQECKSQQDEFKNKQKNLIREQKNLKNVRDELQNNRKKFWSLENKLKKEHEECSNSLQQTQKDLRNVLSYDMYKTYHGIKQFLLANKDSADPEMRSLLQGVYGPLIEIFSADAKYWMAIEGTAQNKLFYWVVDNDSTASKLIQVLRKNRLGRVTIMPLNRLRSAAQATREYPKTPDVIGVMDCLQYDEEAYPLVKRALLQVFGNSLITRDLNVGHEYAMRDKFQCVTLDGDCVNSYGGMDGGFNENKYCKMKQVTAIQEATDQLQQIEQELASLTTKMNENDIEITENINNLKLNENQLQKLNNSKTHQLSKIDELESETIRLKNLLDNEYAEMLQNCEQRINNYREQISKLKLEMQQKLVRKLSKDEVQKLNELTNEIENIQKELNENITQQLIDIKTNKSNIESLLEHNLNRQKTQLQKHIAKCEKLSLKYEQELDQFTHKFSVETEKLAVLQNDFKQLQKNEVQWQKSQTDYESKCNKLCDERQVLMQDIEEQSLESEKYVAKRQALRENLQQLNRRIRDLGSLDRDSVEEYSQIENIKRLRKLLVGVNKDLEQFKNVNKKALNQYNSFTAERGNLEQRNDQQKDDSQHIFSLIEHLDRKKDDAIDRTFHAINENFQQAFKEIVLRGQAKLVLLEKEVDDEMKDEEKEDEQKQSRRKRRRRRRRRSSNISTQEEQEEESDDQKDAGLEFERKYSGVGIRVSFVDDASDASLITSMHELSGGQQTVVALALIFAIQRCDPSPFYVFDEIDAALDSQYRRAVADIIEAQKGNTQFITTTFRRELLETGDKCFVVEFRNKVSTVKEAVDSHGIDISKYQ